MQEAVSVLPKKREQKEIEYTIEDLTKEEAGD
jgi:hypothetical protein